MKDMRMDCKQSLGIGTAESNEVIRPFTFNLLMETMQFHEYYEVLYRKRYTFNQDMVLRGRMSPINFQPSKRDMTQIMKTMYHNIMFNDGNNDIFIFEYEKTHKESKKVAAKMTVELGIEHMNL